MDTFSISQLEQFSGIKAHTIRIWEKRYNALTPYRSEGNTRFYNNSQFRRLLNITSLMDAGYKVSELCLMKDKEMWKIIDARLKNISAADETTGYFISQLISTGMLYDEIQFEKLFANCTQRWGLKSTYIKVIYPMLVRIGIMWSNDSIPPAQEHFISNIIRKKISAAIDSLPPPKSSKHSWLLFLPENEFHDIGLMFSHFIIRTSGKHVIYLGSNVPMESLVSAVKNTNPANLLFFLVHHNIPQNIQNYLKVLKTNFEKIKIHLSANERLSTGIKSEKGINWIHSVEELEKEIS